MCKTWTCPYCGIEKELKSKVTKSGHLAKCKAFQKWKNETLTKEFLEEEYIDQGKSAREIADDLNLSSTTTIMKMLDKHGIDKRNISQAKKEERVDNSYSKF